VTESLLLLLADGDAVDLSVLCDEARVLLAPCSAFTAAEREYLRLLTEEAEYRPSLLLDRWPEVLARAETDPVMQWKVLNLQKRTAKTSADSNRMA